MSIIIKYILKNMKEKKLRSLLIVISLTLSVIILTLCLTLKDNVIAKYTEFLMKTYGTSDIAIGKEYPFEISKLNSLSDNYNIVPYYIYNGENDDYVIGANIEDLKKNEMLKSSRKNNLKDGEVIITEKTAKSKNININEIIEICNEELKVVEIVPQYGIFVGETEDKPVYLTSINMANRIMLGNIDEETEIQLDKNKIYIQGAYIDVVDDDIDNAKEEIKKIDKDFKVLTIKTNLDEALNQISSLMLIMFVITTLIAFYIISSILKLVLEERIPVIGTFRSIGASRRETNFLLYLENSIYGIISSIIGIFISVLLSGPVTNSFINSGDLELTSSAGIRPIYMVIVVAFTIIIQTLITYFELRKNKNKSIKDIIFETQDTKYKVNKIKVIIGFILILLSAIIYMINDNYDFIMGILPAVLVVVGFVLAIPILIKFVSKVLSIILKNTGTAYMACKNVADNKVVLSSTVLLFIIISMTTMIYNISVTITNTYEGFDKATHYTMRINNVNSSEEKYEYINDIEGVKEVAFYYMNMGYYKIENNEKVFAFVGYDNQDSTVFKLYDSIVFNKSEADELKQNEILLDEAFAIKNNYKIGDKMKVGSEQYLNDEYEFTVKGFIDSINTTSMRTVGMVSKDMYIKMFGNRYKCILVSSDLPDDVMKEKLKNEIKDKGVEVVSYQEWIGSDKENTNQVMNIVYGILILGILLSMVGLINNGLVAYVQRKRSFAVLNSICMTKKQLYKMAIVENILSFIIAVVPGMIFGLIINIYMEKTTAGMDIFINTVFEIKGVLVLLGIILSLTVVETIVPIRKIKKMDLVKEIKYE